jgi:tetratricopeptide (TPR) repeat protein
MPVSRYVFLSLIVAVVIPLTLFSLPASASESATQLLAAGRVDEAIAALNVRLSFAPANPELSNLMCRAYYEVEDWDQAEPYCRKAVSLNPDNGRYHFWLGLVYGEKADRSNFLTAANLAVKVRAEFERAVQLDPKDLDAQLDLSEFYIEAPAVMGGGEQKARAQARSIALLNPGREHWVYARLAEQKKDPSTAEREYHQYIDLSSGDAEAWLNLALFLRRQTRLDEMDQAFVRLGQAPLSKPGGLVEASEVLLHTGRKYPTAIEFLRRYLAIGPVEAAPAFKAHYLLGELLEKQGDKQAAIAEYRSSLLLARNFNPAQQALTRVTH